jgi:hypothetical protein
LRGNDFKTVHQSAIVSAAVCLTIACEEFSPRRRRLYRFTQSNIREQTGVDMFAVFTLPNATKP